jgi:hypothetical protein
MKRPSLTSVSDEKAPVRCIDNILPADHLTNRSHDELGLVLGDPVDA